MNNHGVKRAVVIGASSGIGREVACLLIADGWNVAVGARRLQLLEELRLLATDRVIASALDVNDEHAPEVLLSMIRQLGGVDLFFYASGIGKQNRTLAEDIELRTVQTNGLGFTRMVGTAFRYMADNEGGHIACISSIAGTKGLGPAPAYSATKAFQNTYIQALEQLAHTRQLNIHFTDLRPGFVDTDLLSNGNNYPMLLDKREVARQIFQSVKKRRHVQVFDWRWRILTAFWRRIPRFLWRKMKL